jgi:hypothetical protein
VPEAKPPPREHRSARHAKTLREASEGAGGDLANYVRPLGIEALDVEDALALLNAATGLADYLRVTAEATR